ncbi:MAG TPA: UvrB/UvrC motif-containing protein, partial [Clostridia bacterium]|nr:UvrB/UvrC motif-containing protein [Clostridia bacterium]
GINLLREGIDLPEVTLVAILDADKEGFLRSAWSLIQMIGRAARNIGGEVIMYADTITESMQVAIDETDRRRAIQDAYNRERGIEPTTIVKEIHDLNSRLHAVAESTVVYASERGGADLSEADRAQVEKVLARMEAEMRAAAKELEFERAAAIRDEIQQVRLRVLEQDASIIVGRAAERAASGGGLEGAAERARGRRRDEAAATRPAMEVTSVTVLPADEEPADSLDGVPGEPGEPGGEAGTASDWLPGIRDEHEDDAGWQARWLERPTWDRTVTPNVIRRTGTRPPRPGRRRR